tara:strand:+ start:12647 stop:13648 length:1002 start_codon:yes stop_codon:yes gene_type:complete
VSLFKIFLVLFVLSGCTALNDLFNPITEADKKLLEEASLNFEPLPSVDFQKMDEQSKARITLGKRLYLDPILSVNNQISCNSCHRLDNFGVDNEATSPGHEGKRGDRNSPSSFNAFLHISQFWDGRARDVEEQALGPILNPVEMGMASDKDVLKKISRVESYKSDFKKAFPSEKSPIKYRNIGIAIGAFERMLVTPSRFDDYLKGDIRALSSKERSGLSKFIEVGCVSCHNGSTVGGGMYQKLGAIEDYPQNEDLGLYNVTKNEDDKYFFKVPSLRNVEHTGPWLHDGSITDLNEMIKIMGRFQLGVELPAGDINEIRAFLSTLTGQVPEIVN